MKWYEIGFFFIYEIGLIVTPPARRAWKFASLKFSGFFSVSQVGLPLIAVTDLNNMDRARQPND